MKKTLFFIVFAVYAISILAQNEYIKVMTYNIRCGFCEDSSDVNNWSKRKYLVAYLIKNHNPDLIGLQEAEMFQVKELIEMLDEYDWYGVSREDGKEGGESTAILYRTKRFKLKEKRTLWLSETPELVSKGWDAAFKRTVTIAKLKDLKSQKEFYYLNTHFDHKGETARIESSRLIVKEINKYSKDYPIILSGDFNYTSSSEGYKIITGKLSDSKSVFKKESIGGNITFNGFGKDIRPDNKIDFIFVNDKVEVLNHIIDTTTFNGLFPSDHYPVIADILLK
ncbi:MAG: endonuclease/exonuclease/phosphatase family protein [Ignavibacterium sp.]|jgi:endonuclease/exonuclease/phosphatase family metal-dependent hydrolase|nr:endonuclease/exonuclease/phosphatase family protein [Ignavibacterium sp.]